MEAIDLLEAIETEVVEKTEDRLVIEMVVETMDDLLVIEMVVVDLLVIEMEAAGPLETEKVAGTEEEAVDIDKGAGVIMTKSLTTLGLLESSALEVEEDAVEAEEVVFETEKAEEDTTEIVKEEGVTETEREEVVIETVMVAVEGAIEGPVETATAGLDSIDLLQAATQAPCPPRLELSAEPLYKVTCFLLIYSRLQIHCQPLLLSRWTPKLPRQLRLKLAKRPTERPKRPKKPLRHRLPL